MDTQAGYQHQDNPASWVTAGTVDKPNDLTCRTRIVVGVEALAGFSLLQLRVPMAGTGLH